MAITITTQQGKTYTDKHHQLLHWSIVDSIEADGEDAKECMNEFRAMLGMVSVEDRHYYRPVFYTGDIARSIFRNLNRR